MVNMYSIFKTIGQEYAQYFSKPGDTFLVLLVWSNAMFCLVLHLILTTQVVIVLHNVHDGLNDLYIYILYKKVEFIDIFGSG